MRTPIVNTVLGALLIALAAAPAHSLDTVVVGGAPTSSGLPYFVALDRGYFLENGIEIDAKVILSNANLLAALVANQIEAAPAILAVEGMTANLKKPGSITYIALNAQNRSHAMEQFVVREGYEAETLADLKGAKIVSAPGIGNVSIAKAALEAAGLDKDDYSLDQLPPDQHVNVMVSGQFDAAYTLEPGATIMRHMGVARTLADGIIANVVLGDPEANAYVGGAALASDFVEKRADVARRYARAWAQAVEFINTHPDEARGYLIGNTTTPEEIVGIVPMIRYTMVADLSEQDIDNLQAYVDFAERNGVIPGGVDVRQFLKAY